MSEIVPREAVPKPVAATLKTRFGADEVVTSFLLNFSILVFVQMMLEGPFNDPMGLGWLALIMAAVV